MIIDFHTHIFPDKIAQKTIDLLSEKGGIPPFSDGSVEGLLARMKEAEIDLSITLPVLTNPMQFDRVNAFAAQINAQFESRTPRLISFAGIHPDCENPAAKIKQIKECGFLGIKIHPDYQTTYMDDEKYVRILQAAKEYDLIVVTHAGVDTAFRDTVRCTPERALKIIRSVRHPKLVLAHMGANEMPSEVMDRLCEEDVYFDTAYVLRFIGEKNFKTILKKHGADRILFATDSPWSNIKDDVEIIRSFGLGHACEEKIFCENAKKLLNIR